MECFHIVWQGLFSFEEARNDPAARENGVYVAYECTGRTIKRMCYIGKSQELGPRLGTHRLGLARFLREKDMRKYRFSLATILSLERSVASHDITPKQLSDIESFLRNHYRPSGNDESTKKGYKGEPLLLINTGKLGKIDKLIAYNTDLLPLIKKNLGTTKPRRNDDW